MRHAPAFWWETRPTALARYLAPLGAVYGAVTARRMARPGLALPVPVICVGNLVAGGAGKTPTALALGRLLADAGWHPAFLSRGYGRVAGRASEPIRVDRDHHDAATVGDEPLLLAATAPTYVARDRPAAARRAIADGATVLILDDGLQSPALRKTLTLAVVDGATGIGNGFCLPAGPLRAPVARQWPSVSGICIIGGGDAGRRVAAEAERQALPVWSARLVPDPSGLERLKGLRLHAFAGIGRPAKFFATLDQAGLAVASTTSFPDHHDFTSRDLAALRASATANDAHLVTTTKDKARLPADFPALTLPVTWAVDAPDRFAAWVLAGLGP